MNASKQLAGGLYVAVVTPFDDDEALDLDAFRAVVSHIVDGGVDGLVVAGTTGEAHALSFDERRKLFETAVAEAGGRVAIVAGAGATTTREARRLVAIAADCGCSAAMVLTPWFEPVTSDALARYFADVAEDAPLPILLYHNPSRTHVDWPAECIGEVARQLQGVVIGIKDSVGDPDRVAAIRSCAPEGFLIFSGGAHQRAVFEQAGADGCISAVANAHPLECAEAYSGNEARIAYCAAIDARYEQSPNYLGLLKYAMWSLGMPAGKPRRPFDVVAADEWLALKRVVGKGGRLVAGEAGRPTAARDVDSGRVVHLLEPGLVEGALESEPIRAETVALWHPERGDYQYACHPSITYFGGRFFASSSSGRYNEDSPAQVSRFAISEDGRTWSEPRSVMPTPAGRAIWTPGGFWIRDRVLWHLDVRYTRARYVSGEAHPGVCFEDLAAEGFEWGGDDEGWIPRGLALDDIYINEAPRPLPNGNFLMTGVSGVHDALVAVGGRERFDDWRVSAVNRRARTGLLLTEPSWFLMKDGRIRLLLRDDGGSRRIWTCESGDLGETWTDPVPTDFTDAGAKFYALTLPNGEIALIGNSSGGDLRRRFMSVAISPDGVTFTRLHNLCLDPDATIRLKGMHKEEGFNYPNAVVAEGRLWIILSVNKEDVELRSIDLADL